MYALIACGVFRPEIEHLAGTLGFPTEVHYLDPGLHVSFDALESKLRDALEACRAKRTIVAFGACHPRMEEMLAEYGAALLDCQNCVDAFITREEVERRAARGLYFYLSPGWIEVWPDIFRQLGWGQDEARLEMGCFKGAVFIDTLGNAAKYEDDLLNFLDFTLLTYEVVPGNLEHFSSLIRQAARSLGG
ncbi:MAG: hypothetical protein A4E45_02241 [Methanosaeta sp. PtaB.Bin039]|nr:MAG: hypothetical protein A4E45_02241 [Methanosaeta sp. PtaB.Bin039]HOT06041.1 DUF1638 domain-containing protein [Methanotrichaceae archaeon]HQF16309.1 DUF1638 domain-containing protein [Methanotrichaceae archaeon]HQI90081.1 DUF1638 domain-containing protein [Methanotrichaceae archaeon]HQJ27896.1 DUF1638 domain-containing protein [Methanotrichaceae archaeon]